MTDARAFRQAMGHFPTGVTVVAARDSDDQPYGLTVNSLTSVSLDPPLVLVCIDRRASSHDRLTSAATFAVSILSDGQQEVAQRFAAEPSDTRFDEVPWVPGPTGDPVLEDATAWLACSRESVHRAGDHSIVVGRVEAVRQAGTDALAFYRGRFGRVAE